MLNFKRLMFNATRFTLHVPRYIFLKIFNVRS